MKKFILLALACLLLTSTPQPAQAQSTLITAPAETRPSLTPPDLIVMLFHKLIGKEPDFDQWARQTSDYQNASTMNKAVIQDKYVKTLREVYSLQTTQEPVIVEIPVKLSQYSTTHKGFFVESFKDSTFFPVEYNNTSYALIPLDIMDHQWIPIPETDIVERIQRITSREHNNTLTMVFELTPKYADSKNAAFLDGKDYWLIATEVKNMMLYDDKDQSALWRSDTAAIKDKKHQELLRLKQ